MSTSAWPLQGPLVTSPHTTVRARPRRSVNNGGGLGDVVDADIKAVIIFLQLGARGLKKKVGIFIE